MAAAEFKLTRSDSLESPTQVVELCVNLDDTSGEVVGHTLNKLLEEGALDAWTTPIGMKHGRPAVQLSVLIPQDSPAETERFAARIIESTGSFGVRFRPWDRVVLDRKFVEAETSLGTVTLKVGTWQGRTLVVQPEMRSVQKLAGHTGCSVREALAEAQGAASQWKRHASGSAS